MTPEEFAQLKRDIAELKLWRAVKELQQLSYPLDEASKSEVVTPQGAGATALTQVYTDSRGDTVTAPKAYAGSEKLLINGRIREIGYIA